MILGIFIIILSLAIGLIPSIWETIKTSHNGKKSLTRIGKFVVFVLVPLTVIFQSIQIWQGESDREEILTKAEKDKGILINTFLTETKALRKANEDFILNNNKSIVDPYVQGLAKYGLKYDTSQLVIRKLVRDSLKTIVYNDLKPEIAYNNILIATSKDTVRHTLLISSQQSTVYKFKGSIYCIVRTNDNRLFIIGKFFPLSLNKLTLGTEQNLPFTSFGAKENALVNTFAFYYLIIGTYTDHKGKQFVENTLVGYSKMKNVMFDPTEKEELWIRDFCQKRNLK